jgi:hypothetical protein
MANYLKIMLQNALQDNQGNVYNGLKTIEAVIEQGGSNDIAKILISLAFEEISPKRYGFLGDLLRNNGIYFTPENQEAIAKWLEPLARIQPDKLIGALDTLADQSPLARQLYVELIPRLAQHRRQHQQARLLRFVAIDQHPALTEFNEKAQLFLVDLYGKHANHSALALQKLLEVAKGTRSKKGVYEQVAKRALEYIEPEKIAEGQLEIEDLLSLLKSRFPKARVKSLEFISQIKPQITEQQLTETCSILRRENDQQVAIRLCKLVKIWVNKNKYVPSRVAEAIVNLPFHLFAKNTFDGGVLEVYIPALTAIIQRNDQSLNLEVIIECTCTLLKSIDIGRGESRQNAVALLCAVDRLDEKFLPLLVSNNCLQFAQDKWEENLCAVVGAIGRTKKLYLLDSIGDLTNLYSLTKVEEKISKIRGM